MSKRQNLYLGKAGQMAVMSEFLLRGYNVAVPEVDVGDDIFVVRDRDGELKRIQVKASHARQKGSAYIAQFNVPVRQLRTPVVPPLYYVFAIRHDGRWADFFIIDRDELDDLTSEDGDRSPGGDTITLNIRVAPEDAIWKGRSLQSYRNHWAVWPHIAH
jgi:hypothetical protein